MKYKAILFDMDGVLIDSEVLMRKSGVLALEEWGIHPKDEDFIPFTGQGEDRFIGGVAMKYGLEYDKEMKARAYVHYGLRVEEETEVPEGLLEILKQIKAMGYKMAVCTSADYAKVVHNYRAIGVEESFFDAVITGDRITNKKPDPEIYLTGAAAVGCDPKDCLVVEDAPSGVKAAHAGGMQAVGITSSFDEAFLVKECGPDIVIHSMQELLDVVK